MLHKRNNPGILPEAPGEARTSRTYGYICTRIRKLLGGLDLLLLGNVSYSSTPENGTKIPPDEMFPFV
jgi:hypothetical protein